MIEITQIKIASHLLSQSKKKDLIIKKLNKVFHINNLKNNDIRIVRESLDARNKSQIFHVFNVVLNLDNNKECELINNKNKYGYSIKKYIETEFVFPYCSSIVTTRPVIVGMGPAGLFAGYFLAKQGYKPIIIERGCSVNERKKCIEKFIKSGSLDKETNIQFGEGGAGTFSDGKLNTGTNDKDGIHHEILKIFVENGADESILYLAKPHLGTDVLERIVVSIRKKILENGGEVLFNKQMSDLNISRGRLVSIVVNDNEIIKTNRLILAIGHSARDTFKMLCKRNIKMQQKPFAIGIRVVHDQKFINESQYGYIKYELPAADYKITTHTSNDRNVYSFCMCPGGYIVASASSDEESVVNGMSYNNRDGRYANSAIVVNITTHDFPDSSVLSGMFFQEQLEKTAYTVGKGRIPIQSANSFMNNIPEKDINELIQIADEAILGQYNIGNVKSIFPIDIQKALIEGLLAFNKKIRGYSNNIKLIAGVESRTSSPIKIIRDNTYQSDICGIYPCGEGAGYAGGIMSAATDGIRCALAVATSINKEGSNE